MTDETLQSPASLQAMSKAIGRRLTWWQLAANLIGAGTVTSYFVFFDRVFPAVEIRHTFYVVAIMFPALVAVAAFSMHFWEKDLRRFVRLEPRHREINVDLRRKAQRKILDLPFMSAVLSFFNWFIAAITMTTYSIIAGSGGQESLPGKLLEGLRVFVGCIIGGIVVAAIIFFITEFNRI